MWELRNLDLMKDSGNTILMTYIENLKSYPEIALKLIEKYN